MKTTLLVVLSVFATQMASANENELTDSNTYKHAYKAEVKCYKRQGYEYGNAPQQIMNGCANEAAVLADKELNSTYSRVRSARGLTSAAQASLKALELSWIPLRDKTCANELMDSAGGTLGVWEQYVCVKMLSIFQIVVLETTELVASGRANTREIDPAKAYQYAMANLADMQKILKGSKLPARNVALLNALTNYNVKFQALVNALAPNDRLRRGYMYNELDSLYQTYRDKVANLEDTSF